MLRLLLNLLWIICGGFVTALGYFLGGVILCLTVVGIPFGVQCMKLAGVALMPFGKDVRDDPAAPGSGVLGTVMNVLWFLVAGLWIALAHVAHAIPLAVSIVGLPFAYQHVKLAVFALFPFGRRIVEL